MGNRQWAMDGARPRPRRYPRRPPSVDPHCPLPIAHCRRTPMLTDISTVIWKEWKEFLGQRSTLLSMLFFLAVFAGLLPLQAGERWVDSPLSVANLVFVPLFFVLTVIADSFAGERERHTLDTLLASRLTDRAILFG